MAAERRPRDRGRPVTTPASAQVADGGWRVAGRGQTHGLDGARRRGRCAAGAGGSRAGFPPSPRRAVAGVRSTPGRSIGSVASSAPRAEHDVVAEGGQLVGRGAALEPHGHRRQDRHLRRQRLEERRVDDQLVVGRRRGRGPAMPARSWPSPAGACASSTDMWNGFEQGQAADVADDRSSRPAEPRGGRVEHAAEVVGIGEVLRDRVDDDHVDRGSRRRSAPRGRRRPRAARRWSRPSRGEPVRAMRSRACWRESTPT